MATVRQDRPQTPSIQSPKLPDMPNELVDIIASKTGDPLSLVFPHSNQNPEKREKLKKLRNFDPYNEELNGSILTNFESKKIKCEAYQSELCREVCKNKKSILQSEFIYERPRTYVKCLLIAASQNGTATIVLNHYPFRPNQGEFSVLSLLNAANLTSLYFAFQNIGMRPGNDGQSWTERELQSTLSELSILFPNTKNRYFSHIDRRSVQWTLWQSMPPR